jgi:ABC-type nitrate/sulfonate/bicarbonate transport system permease component
MSLDSAATATRLRREQDEAALLEDDFRAKQRAQKRRGIAQRLILNILGVVLVLAVWEMIPRMSTMINDVMFPPPSIVLETAIPMILSGEILHNIYVSLKRAAAGFALAGVLAIFTGVITARLAIFNFLTEPVLHGARSLPAIALVPLSVLWFGIGEGAKIALVCWGAYFPIWINTFIGVRDIHPVYLRSSQCLGAGRLQTIFWVVLPAALPMILAGLRQSIAISLIVLVAAELSGATAGVAYMMSMGHQLFRVDIMFIGLFILALLGFLADRLFVFVSRRLFPWYTTFR